MSLPTTCAQRGCESRAAYRYTWPGRDEAGVCVGHETGLRALAASMGLPLQLIPLAGDPACTRCEGSGAIANTDEGEPWSAWASLPPGADLAVRSGLVRPIPCPACSGSAGE